MEPRAPFSQVTSWVVTFYHDSGASHIPEGQVNTPVPLFHFCLLLAQLFGQLVIETTTGQSHYLQGLELRCPWQDCDYWLQNYFLELKG